MMLYSCTHMATVGFKGLKDVKFLMAMVFCEMIIHLLLFSLLTEHPLYVAAYGICTYNNCIISLYYNTVGTESCGCRLQYCRLTLQCDNIIAFVNGGIKWLQLACRDVWSDIDCTFSRMTWFVVTANEYSSSIVLFWHRSPGLSRYSPQSASHLHPDVDYVEKVHALCNVLRLKMSVVHQCFAKWSFSFRLVWIDTVACNVFWSHYLFVWHISC